MYKRHAPLGGTLLGAKVLVSVEEAADLLSVGRTVVYRLVAQNEVRSIKVGRTRRIVVDSLHEYVGHLLEQAC